MNPSICDDYTVDDLKDMCKKNDITGYSRMRKDELIEKCCEPFIGEKTMKKEETRKIEMPDNLLDGIDLEGFTQVFFADKGEEIRYKKSAFGGTENEPINKITKEPYIGCGLAESKNLKLQVLPSLYYNAKVGKAVLLVGPSGTGKTTIGKCFIQNFANARLKEIKKAVENGMKDKDVKNLVMKKQMPTLRIQHYANILPEAIVGEWNAHKMLHAPADETNLFDKDEYFRLGPMTEALYNQEDKHYQGRGILLDEITRANEEIINVHLEPLREKRITVEGNCFGECEPGEERSRFYVIATANEGDVGTIDLPSAGQTRFSREPVDFITPEAEQRLVKDVLKPVLEKKKLTSREEKEILDLASSKKRGAPCFTSTFRNIGNLTVKPSIGDTVNIAKLFAELEITKDKLGGPKGAELKDLLGHVVLSMLGKNENDARNVRRTMEKGVCGITIGS